MRTRRLFQAALVAWVAAACGDGPSTPTDPLSQATFTVDGQTFVASPNGRSALDRGFGVTDIMSQDCSSRTSVLLSVVAPLAVGPHPIDRVSQASFFTPGTQYDYPRGQATGSLTFSSVSPRLVGQYAFEVRQLVNGLPTGPSKVVQGSFDVSYGNGTVCE